MMHQPFSNLTKKMFLGCRRRTVLKTGENTQVGKIA
ncbi:hypothetical protein CBM2634_B10037 [Cupriavidus taiwanensis]|uniref:Uncharacterized protein n=1 Tax=Cupriavidus taiwanensis TaxID=164546 RepID=A0A375J3A8_9BURK|nr:hypothetical protein CBM2634_B10037 [Cupriavidus taiwanensis]